MQITRREFCQGAASGGARRRRARHRPRCRRLPAARRWRRALPPAELMKPRRSATDMALGNDKAPVTIIEYASMTCPHCAHFQETTFPELKKRYIDTGKVRYILREFPLDPLAAAAFMLARCAGKRHASITPMVDTLFRQQTTLGGREAAAAAARRSPSRPASPREFRGLPGESEVLDASKSVRQRAIDKFKVQSTPTFFINGKMQVGGALTIEEMAKVIEPLSQGRIRVFRRPSGGSA